MTPSLGDTEARNTFGPAPWSMTAGFTTTSNTAPVVAFTVTSMAKISGNLISVVDNDLKRAIATARNIRSLGIN